MKIALDEGAFLPSRGHTTDAGMDLLTPKGLLVMPNSSVVVDTGVHVELPPNTVGMLKSKSGLNVKHGITSEGVIDVGYTGSIVASVLAMTIWQNDWKLCRWQKRHWKCGY